MVRRKVRRRFFQESDVFLLLGDLPAQPGQLVSLSGCERLLAALTGGVEAPAFIGHPAAEQAFVETEIARDLGNGIDQNRSLDALASTLYSVVNDRRFRDM